MSYKNLPLHSLLVNRANDRHGELDDEADAIAWLFVNHESQMRKLAKDLAQTGEIYEPPIVSLDGSSYVVFDGNRRVTCLKLIAEPERAPNEDLRRFFTDLKQNWNGSFPGKIECQIEEDIDRIDEILLRRHTGTRGGVGRSPWNDRMTAHFEARTGKGTGLNVADEVEKHLRAANMLPTKKIPWSTVKRLLSSETIRKRVGISLSSGKFKFIYPEAQVLPILRRIAEDLANKSVVLGDLWNNERKGNYLDRLEREGVLALTPIDAASDLTSEHIPVLPDIETTPKPDALTSINVTTIESSAKETKFKRRLTLIPQLDHSIKWTARTQRQHQIWDELQFKLNIEEHPNAISVLFRVLFELSIDHYIQQTKLEVHSNDSLKNKVKKVGFDLESKSLIDAKYAGLIRKLESADGIFSIDTLNRYVHSADFAPSPKHLTALWGQVSKLIETCLNT